MRRVTEKVQMWKINECSKILSLCLQKVASRHCSAFSCVCIQLLSTNQIVPSYANKIDDTLKKEIK